MHNKTLIRKYCHFDEIFITGCIASCHFDNLQCSQWWKFRQNDNFPFQLTRCMFHGINCKYIKVYIITLTPCDNHRSQGRSERPAHVAFQKTFHFQLAPLLIDYELRMTTVSNLEKTIIVYLIVVRIWFFPCYSVCSQSDTFSFVHLSCFSTSLSAGEHVRLRKHRRMYVYMCVFYVYIYIFTWYLDENVWVSNNISRTGDDVINNKTALVWAFHFMCGIYEKLHIYIFFSSKYQVNVFPAKFSHISLSNSKYAVTPTTPTFLEVLRNMFSFLEEF